MKMMKSVAWLGLSVCAATLIVGCGGKKAAEPAVPEGSALAMLCDYRLDAQRPEFKKMAASTLKALDLLSDEMKGLKAVIEKQVAAVGTPEGARWCVLSVGDVDKYEFGKPFRAPDVGVAIAAPKAAAETSWAEIKKALLSQKDAKEGLDEFAKNADVVDAEIAGCKAQKLVFKGEAEKELKENKVSNVVPCMAWLGDDLLLAASSEKGLADLIALYRDGKGAAAIAFDRKMCSIVVPAPGKLAAKFADDEMLGGVPGGAAFVKGLTDFRVTYGFSADGKNLEYTTSVMSADEKTAQQLREQATGLLALGKMAFADKKPAEMSGEEKLGKLAIDSVKIEGKADLRLSASIPVDAVLGSVEDTVRKLPSLL